MAEIRKELGLESMDGSNVPVLMKNVSGHLTGSELVHTGYFLSDSVVDLIARTIAGPGRSDHAVSASQGLSAKSWLESARHEFRSGLPTEPVHADTPASDQLHQTGGVEGEVETSSPLMQQVLLLFLACLPAALGCALVVPLLYKYTPQYQVKRILADAPVVGGFRFRPSDRAWAEAVGLAGQPAHPLADARRIEDPESRANLLVAIALAKSGSVSDAITVAGEALEATNSIPEPFSRSLDLLELAEFMAPVNTLEEQYVSAIQLARKSSEMLKNGSQFRAIALASVASRMSFVPELAADSEVVFENALLAAESTFEPTERWDAAVNVARSRLEWHPAGDPAQALLIAIEAVDKLQDPEEADLAFLNISWSWAYSGNVVRARTIADQIKDRHLRSRAFGSIATATAKLGHPNEALALLDEMDDEDAEIEAMNDLVRLYEDSQQLILRDSVLQRILAVDNPLVQADGFLKAAETILAGNDHERADELLERALHAAAEMPSDQDRASIRLRIANGLFTIGALEQGMTALELGIHDGNRTTGYDRYQWVRQLVSVVDRLFEKGQREQAISLLKRAHREAIKLQTRREDALSEVAEALARAGFFRAARKVCEVVTLMGDSKFTLRSSLLRKATAADLLARR